MNNKSIVSMFLLLFFVILGAAGAACSGYFFDVGGHGNIASALGWTAGICLLGAIVCAISLFSALWSD